MVFHQRLVILIETVRSALEWAEHEEEYERAARHRLLQQLGVAVHQARQ
jgi:hypothetical protein